MTGRTYGARGIRQVAAASGTALWLLIAVAGLRTLSDYSLAAGESAQAPSRWPAETRLPRFADQPVLVVIAHPLCPCSRATIGELNRLMSHVHGRVTVHVVFVRPPGAGEEWTNTDLWRSAVAIPDVTAWSDEGGVEASRFGAATSGQAILYDGDGRLVFSGGITAARGHFGDNAGSQALARLLIDGMPSRPHTPVFGCALFDRAMRCAQGGDACRS